MKINSFTNYAFRILIMLGANRDKTISLAEVASAYGISLNHLKKVSARLVDHKLVITERGRSGGLRLSCDPAEIRLGDIFRISQTDTAFVECMGGNEDACVISPVCRLQGIFIMALKEFETKMDEYTLADLVVNAEEINQQLGVDLIATTEHFNVIDHRD